LQIQSVNQADCRPDGGAVTTTDYGATLYGSEGYDDDCKYHVAWSSTPIRENTDVTFTLHVDLAGTMTPATGGQMNNDTYVEAFIGNHPGDTARSNTVENPPGTYSIGPVSFDQPGKWTVRFHLFGDCYDVTPDSPHGHAAFYVQVP
jgi:hypothetical protein